MPRRPAPRNPAARSDGQVTAGNVKVQEGQPNGRIPKGLPIAAAAGTGAPTQYGDGQQLKADVQQTPLPTGVTPMGDDVRKKFAAHYRNSKVTPLFSPTERPWEHVTAGAPLGAGPTNPMAQPMAGTASASIANILQQAADASGSPALRALAAKAAAVAGTTAPGAMMPTMAGATPPPMPAGAQPTTP
jgi:hypothetical protein